MSSHKNAFTAWVQKGLSPEECLERKIEKSDDEEEQWDIN